MATIYLYCNIKKAYTLICIQFKMIELGGDWLSSLCTLKADTEITMSIYGSCALADAR